jgi:hypothetical protein
MTLPEIYDEYGRLDLAEQQKTPGQERLATLKKHIITLAEAEPANAPVTYDGEQFFLQLTARSNEREIIDLGKVYKFVVAKRGLNAFLDLCKFPLAAVDANIPEARRAEFVSEAQTGTRRINAVLRALPDVA